MRGCTRNADLDSTCHILQYGIEFLAAPSSRRIGGSQSMASGLSNHAQNPVAEVVPGCVIVLLRKTCEATKLPASDVHNPGNKICLGWGRIPAWTSRSARVDVGGAHFGVCQIKTDVHGAGKPVNRISLEV